MVSASASAAARSSRAWEGASTQGVVSRTVADTAAALDAIAVFDPLAWWNAPAPERPFLDEVGAGVNRTLLNTIGDAILRLNAERGYTFVVIEHDMDFIGRLCEPVICMAEGRVLAEGTLDQIKADERVIEAYLRTGLKNKQKAAAT